MPEGPEIKTIAHTLDQALASLSLGKLWHSDLSLRTPFDTLQLKKREGFSIDGVKSYGKIIFIYSKSEPILLAQMGMTGRLVAVKKDDEILAHTHVRWGLLNSDLEIRYVDPRRFGAFEPCDANKAERIKRSLGPDPFFLSKEEISSLALNFKKSSRVIKQVLLDQMMIAGVGNIYASEALFLAKIDPRLKTSELSLMSLEKLIQCIISVMEQAYKNGGTTFSDYVDGQGNKGSNFAALKVFMREGLPCPHCSHEISRIVQNGRSTFLCEGCLKN